MASVFGFLGGVLTTSINVNAPPIVLYLVNLGFAKNELRATTAAFLISTQVLGLGLLAVGGLVTRTVLLTSLALAPACLIGVWAGQNVVPHVKPALFSKLVLGMGIATFVGGLPRR